MVSRAFAWVEGLNDQIYFFYHLLEKRRDGTVEESLRHTLRIAGRAIVFATLINAGGYDRQIRKSRLVYRRRRDRLFSALSREAPAVRLTGIAAGLHAVADLPAHETEAEVISRAARRGVAVEGLGSYTVAGHERGPALVVGYGRPAEHAFTTAVGRLCAALAESA